MEMKNKTCRTFAALVWSALPLCNGGDIESINSRQSYVLRVRLLVRANACQLSSSPLYLVVLDISELLTSYGMGTS